jgi:Amt family ammonium transporter
MARRRGWRGVGFLTLLTALAPGVVFAQETPAKIDSGDTTWILVCSALVLLMTIPGLALFYGGLVRRKNALGTIMHCFVIAALISVQWVLWGYSLAFGPDVGGLVGNLDWVGLEGVGLGPSDYAPTIPHQAFMVFQLMFAIITPALIIGSFAERMKFSTFLIFTLLWATFIYDPLAHWVWGGGWLGELGALDFAGGTVVHISSGISALACAIIMGKRLGYGTEPMPPHNLPFTVIGASLLWVGWFGFNAGSALAADGLATNAFVVTNTAAAAATLTWMLSEWIAKGKPTVLGAATGAVAGLVAITPAAGFVGAISAIIIGVGAGIFCYSACNLKTKLGYDDSLDVVGVHGVGGIWGALATGLFASTAINPGGADGLFFGNPAQLKIQAIAVAATCALAFIGTTIILGVLNVIMGLRVTEEGEVMGLDLSEHSESAYALELPAYGGPAMHAPAPRPAREEAPRRPAPAAAGPGRGMRTPPTGVGARTPPSPGQTEPVRGASLAAAGPATKEQPFRIVVRGVDKKLLREVWQHLCHEYPHNTPSDFNEMYEHSPRFSDDSFAFKKGDPKEFRETFQNLLYIHGIEGAVVTVER